MTSATSIGRIADAPNASQGFNRSCAHAKLAGREPMTFQAFLARHGKNWPQGEAIVTEQDERIAALEAELASLRAPVVEDTPSEWVKGRKFSYTARNGNVTKHTVASVKAGRVISNLKRKNGEPYSFAVSALEGYAASQVS